MVSDMLYTCQYADMVFLHSLSRVFSPILAIHLGLVRETDMPCTFEGMHNNEILGIYHSGVEVAGREYCFGGHEYENLTGVFAVEPKIGPPGVIFK